MDSMQSRGGKARAEKLSPERRRAIASEAARKRWAGREPGTVTKSVTMPAEQWAFVLERAKARDISPSDWMTRMVKDTRKRLETPETTVASGPAVSITTAAPSVPYGSRLKPDRKPR